MNKYAVYGTVDSIYIMATDMRMALNVYHNHYEGLFGEPVKCVRELS